MAGEATQCIVITAGFPPYDSRVVDFWCSLVSEYTFSYLTSLAEENWHDDDDEGIKPPEHCRWSMRTGRK